MNGPRKAEILIVDDEANTLASLARAFRIAGHEATVCDNAATALELAKNRCLRSHPQRRSDAAARWLEPAGRSSQGRRKFAGGDDERPGPYRDGGTRNKAGRTRLSGETDFDRQAAADRRERSQAEAPRRSKTRSCAGAWANTKSSSAARQCGG